LYFILRIHLLISITFITDVALAGGPAINQFEVKDLEVEVGQWEFQSQNAYSWGQPDREFAEDEPGEFEFDENSVVRQRYALELEVGVLEWLRTRVGIEFEQERIDDPVTVDERNDFESLTLEEIALEFVAVAVPVPENGFGWGFLVEYQFVRDRSESDSIVFGPIFESQFNDWSMVLNPALVQFFNGDEKDDKLDFTYAAQLAYEVSEQWDIALEAYGTIDRLGGTGNKTEEAKLFGDHDLHRLGPIAYYNHVFGNGTDTQQLSLGLGMFLGLNSDTPDTTLKWSLEYEF